MTMAAMCQRVSEEEEARGTGVAPRLRGILERGDGWRLVEAEACEGSRGKTQMWEEACDLGGPQVKLETREVGARLCDEKFVCIIFFLNHLLLEAKFMYHLHSIAEKMEAQRGNLAKVS